MNCGKLTELCNPFLLPAVLLQRCRSEISATRCHEITIMINIVRLRYILMYVVMCTLAVSVHVVFIVLGFEEL